MPMTLLSSKLVRTHHDQRHDYGGHIAHWCPACRELHEFAVERPFRNGARWLFGGTFEVPTFSPSMNIRIGPYPDASKKAGQIDVCHYFLKEGRIEYLSDCTHGMVGQTIDLPDLPDEVLKVIAQSERYAAGATG